VPALGVCAQPAANLRVSAGNGDGDRGPVANVPARGGKDAHRIGLGAGGHGGEVAHDTSGPISQSELDCEVKLVDGITERAGDLQDDDLT